MCHVLFKSKTKQVGTTNYTKIHQFSELDLDKFRQVAVLCNRGQPIKDAILSVFREEKRRISAEEENKQLFDKLIKVFQTLDEDRQKQIKDFDLVGQLGRELLLVEVTPKPKYKK